MAESQDFDDAGAIATSISNVSLVGTGLAKEAGGNLASAQGLLAGTSAGALLGSAGNTIAKEIAAMIAGGSITAPPGGVPLLHGFNHVFGVSGQVIGPLGTFTPANIPFTKPGYYIRFTLNGGAGTAATPYCKFDLQWQVAAQGNVDSWEEIWYVNVGTNSNHRTNGRGPAHGDTLKLTITNGDAVKSVTVGLDIWETTHAPARSDWRDNSGVSSGLGGGVGTSALTNIYADINASIPLSGSTEFNLPLYAGQVSLSVTQNNHAGSNITINPVGAFDLANGNPLVTVDWTQPASNYPQIMLPRCPCTLIANNTNTVAVGLLASMTILERVT